MTKALKSVWILIIFAILSSTTASAGAVLNVSSGKLVGAYNIEVDGNLYNVSFMDGTCQELYSGCDSTTDFTFQDLTSAQMAAQALLDQVFLDGPSLNERYNSTPSLTYGCDHAFTCSVIFPYFSPDFTTFFFVSANNFSDLTLSVDAITSGSFDPFATTSDRPEATFANWSLASAVPEPPSPLLFLAGLLAILAGKRRKSVNST